MNTITTDIDSTEARTTAEALSAFLSAIGATEQTRLIGITQAEFAALKRGATLLLGVPSEGMRPIVAGQEVLAIVGYKPGDAPRMDTERLRLWVTADLFDIEPMAMSLEQIAAVTGRRIQPVRSLADIDLTEHLQGVCSELKDFDPATTKRGVPVVVMP